MRKLLSLAASAAILAGAYSLTFGVPTQLSAMIGPDTGDSAETTAAARPQGSRGQGRGSRATTVVTTALELQPYESILSAIGTASAVRSVDVVSDTTGTVTEAHLSANREVEKNEVLVRFDARAEALNLEIAQAELEQANDTVTRYERLRRNGNSTVTDVTLSEARISQRLAEAAVGLAKVALDERTIRAPISGRLGLSGIEVGDTISANTAIVTIDQDDTLALEFELPERAIGMLAKAKEVFATTSAFTGQVIKGQIVSFDSRIDSVTRSVTVKAEIDNSKGQYWPGMTFAVRLRQLSDALPMIPSTAITWSRTGSSVWVNNQGTAEQVPVTILFRQNESVWIDADIEAGTMVVTEGAQKLRNGAQISAAGTEAGRSHEPQQAQDTSTVKLNNQPQETSKEQ